MINISRKILNVKNFRSTIVALMLLLMCVLSLSHVNASSINGTNEFMNMVNNDSLENHMNRSFSNNNINNINTGDFYVYNFEYTGNVQFFTAPLAGEYKLDLWGAQGGHRVLETRGGRGAYSTGIVNLKKGERIAIHVGGYGNSVSRGYNGGGQSQIANVFGGGATDIRIGNYSVNERIIVAAGGGSVGASDKPGAAAGAEVGHSALENFGSGGTGGTQTSPGSLRAAFGRGGSGGFPSAQIRVGSGGGGGGGWYGGGGANSDIQGLDDDRGGGGGSSYILTDDSHKPSGYIPGYSYHLKDASMVDGLSYMPAPNGAHQTGHQENGHVRIEKLDISNNNYLEEIYIKNGYMLEPEFDPETQEYTVHLGVNQTEIDITGIAQDQRAEVSGNGNYFVKPNNHKIELVVTAQNGSTRIYTVNLKRPTSGNGVPNRIDITGMIPSLCQIDDSYCKVSPEIDLVNGTLEKGAGMYDLKVPARIKQLEFSIIKGHEFQTVIMEGLGMDENGVIDLAPTLDESGNISEVYIIVESEDRMETSSYLFTIIRDMTGNADLDSLDLVQPKRDLKFEPDKIEYFTSIPFEYDHTDKLDLRYTTLDSNATVELENDGDLELGTNILTLNVTAENGVTKKYVIYLYREESSNIFLETLNVSDEKQNYRLSPTFNKIRFDYNLIVENDVDTINIEAIAEEESTHVIMESYDGNYDLKVGTNIIKITTQARDGSGIGVYSINIVRKASNNKIIKNLFIDGERIVDFDPTVFHQTIEVDSQLLRPQFRVELEHPYAKYTMGGDHKVFKAGKNTVHIRVMAEDSTVQDYVIDFIKGVSTDSALKELETSFINVEDDFHKDTTEYHYTIDYTTKSLYVLGTANHVTSKVEGNGYYYLSPGINEIKLFVTAEDQESTTVYDLVIEMLPKVPNDNALLKELTFSEGILSQEFDPEVFEYELNVLNDIRSVDLKAIPQRTTTTVEAETHHYLTVGDNKIEIVTTAESGRQETYKINIKRDVSKNADLEFLIVHEGALDKRFFPEVTNYSLKVPFNTKDLQIEAQTVDPNATYTVIDNEDLVQGLNTVTIRVTPDNDGPTKDYVLEVFVQGPSQYDLDLLSLSIKPGSLSPDFSYGRQVYRVTYDNDQTSVQVYAESRHKDVVVEGVGTHTLEVGDNVIVVTTVSPEGIIKDYQIIAHRKKSSEARLRALDLSGLVTPVNTSPYKFNVNYYNYSLYTRNSRLGITPYTMHPNATYEILGNHDFSIENVTNTVTIRVTAEDGIAIQDYTLQMKRLEPAPGRNATLSHLSISGVAFDKNFSSTRYYYEADSEHELNVVNVDAVPTDPKATVTYDRNHQLKVGINYINVRVASADNREKRTYTVRIDREGSGNNYLESLIVDGEAIEDFDKDKTEYFLDAVDYENETVNIEYLLEDETAKVSGVGEVKLKVGDNRLPVTVTSESGNARVYYVNIERRELNSPYLKELDIYNYPFDGKFDPYKGNYEIIVDNEVESLSFEMVKMDPDATVEIIGNENISIGNNTVVIKVTSSKGDKTMTYSINVYKQVYGNTFLDDLTVSSGQEILEMNPTFESGNLVYRVEVPFNYDAVTIKAKVRSNTATVANTGEHELAYGENHIKVIVTDDNGVFRVYHLFIERSRSHNNQLSFLEVLLGNDPRKFTPEFDPAVFEYTLIDNIPAGTERLNLKVISNAPKVVGAGMRDIKVGANKLEIKVTSDSGRENIYTINYIRDASDNTNARMITPSVGQQNQSFSPNRHEYEVEVPSYENVLGFSVVPEDKNAKAIGYQTEVLPSGETIRTVRIIAENGLDHQDYTYIINKHDSTDTRLEYLQIRDFVMNPTFDSDEYDYTITVPNSVKEIERDDVTYRLSDEKGARVSFPSVFSLSSVRDSVMEFKVVAGDGYTIETYRVKFTREKSSEARIRSLSLSGSYLETGFSSNRFSYNVGVNQTTGVFNRNQFYNFKLMDPYSTVEYSHNGNIRVVGDEIVPFTITVTSQDKTVVNVYEFLIGNIKSDDNKLSGITVEQGILKGQFSPDKLNYTVEVLEDASEVIVHAYPRHPKAKVISIDNVTDNNNSIVSIVVESEKGSRATYKLNIVRNLSLNIDLESLELNNAKTEKLKPEYSNEIYEYHGYVERNISSVGLIVGKGHNSQEIVLVDSNNTRRVFDSRVPITAINDIPLKVGPNKFTLFVYNQFGDKREITINITRDVDDNNYLKDIKFLKETDTNTKEPVPFDFDPLIQDYKGIEVPYNVTEVVISPETQSPYAHVEIVSGGKYYNVHDKIPLESGNNNISVRVQAENGEFRTYTFRLFREYAVNNLLQTITVSVGGTIISNKPEFYSPNFDKAIFDYVAKVDSDTVKVSVEGVPIEEDTNITVTVNDDVMLSPDDADQDLKNGVVILPKVGNNRITFTTEKEGQTAKYTVNLVRKSVPDVNLASLQFFDSTKNGKEQFLDKKFDKDETRHTMTIGPKVDSLYVAATPENNKSRIQISGNKVMFTGQNLVQITVTSEDRMHMKTYYVIVTKLMSDNNDLEELTLVPETRDEDGQNVIGVKHHFPKPILALNKHTVKSDVRTIIIGGKVNDPIASVVGYGRYSLDYGENVIEVEVTAQNGDVKIYTIHVFREYENRLNSLDISVGTLDPEFDEDTYYYEIMVPVNTEIINLKAIAKNEPVAKVTYENDGVTSDSGFQHLKLGDNTIRIHVTSPDESYRTTTLKIVRSDSINTSLKLLEIEEGLLTPEFDKSIYEYSTDIKETHDTVNLYLLPDDVNATFEILDVDSNDFVVTEEQIEYADGSRGMVFKVTIDKVKEKNLSQVRIRVIASDPEYTQDTVLTINRHPEALFSNLLSSLTVTPSNRMSPTFRPTMNNYLVFVDPDVTEVEIKATTQIPEAKIISGTGKFKVIPNRNLFEVVVRSKDGIDNVYRITINQVASSDPLLKELSFEEGFLSPVFSSNNFEYRMNVPANTEFLTETIVANRSDTEVNITGGSYTEKLESGENIVEINTIAGNKVDTAKYTIIVNKTAQTSIYLRDIETSLGKFKEPFNKLSEGPYSLELDSGDNSVMISPKPEDPNAIDKIIIDGVTMVGSGQLIDMSKQNSKNVPIVVYGKAGNQMSYYINITKSMSDAVKLTYLDVIPGPMDRPFDPDDNDQIYNVEVDSDVDKVEIVGSWVGNLAVDGLGEKALEQGMNTFEVVVTSDLGDVGVYTIHVNRKVNHSARILSLLFNEAIIENPAFDKDHHKYSLYVPYEVDQITIHDIVLEDEANSEYKIVHTPTQKLTVGSDNKVIITVENSISKEILEYEFTVTRYPFTSNFLASLTTNKGDLTPLFDKYTISYDIEVPYEVDEIELKGSPEDAASIVTGIGTYKDLKVGINELKVIVTKDNVPRVYIVRVNRLEDSSNDLINLEVVNGVMNIPFDSETYEYDVEVGEEFGTVEFIGEIPLSATVVGLNNMTVTENETLKGNRVIRITQPSFTHEIVITAKDGSIKTYTFNITKLLSSEVNIDDIVPTIKGQPVADQGYEFDTPFSDDIESYTMEVSDITSHIGFDVITSPLNQVVGNEEKQLTHGDNIFNISVTSEDGSLTKSYVINVIRTKEIQSITIDPNTLVMNVGEIKDLFNSEDVTVEIMPVDASSKSLIWESDDEEIVSVDENGVLIGHKPGNVTIKVQSETNENIYSIVNVEVLLLQLESDILDIVRFDPDIEGSGLTDDEFGITDYVIGSKDLTEIIDYKQLFLNDDSTMVLYDENNQELTNESDLVGSKMIIRLEINGTIYDELRIAIRGDLDGDGYIIANDLVVLEMILLNLRELDQLTEKISDLDLDGYVIANDMVILELFQLGLRDEIH